MYRYEAVEYANILDSSIALITEKLKNLDADDEIKQELTKITSQYNQEGIQLLI